MYVCICNALNCRSVTRAIDGGAATVAQVYKTLGAVPQCGKCKDLIREMLADRVAAGRDPGLQEQIVPEQTVPEQTVPEQAVPEQTAEVRAA